MLRHLLAATVAVVGLTAPASAQLYFRDNFTGDGNLQGRVPSSSIGSTWSATAAGGATAVTASGILNIDNGGSNDSNAYGSSTIGNGFASTTLTNLPRWVEWRFNMRIDVSPTGFGGAQNGVAVVLAATATNLDTASGYAVAFGRNGSQFEIVSFNAGLDGTLTAFASSTVAPLASNTNFASVRVTYNPVTDNWQLFVRDDGGSGFTDPYSGTINSVTGLVNNTTFTSTGGLNQVGAYLSFDSTNGRTGSFDNFSIAAVPEPTTWALIGLSAAGLIGGVYRYRRGAAKTLNTEVDVEANEVA